MIFNRFETNLELVKLAFYENDIKYCNPEDYNVTEEECLRYIEDIKNGQKKKKEWNIRHNKRKIIYVIVLGTILTLSIPTVIFLWFDKQESSLAYPACVISTWIIIGTFAWLFNTIEKNNRNVTFFLDHFFPPANPKIDKLFNDYLLKRDLEKESAKMNEEERKRTRERIAQMSHPYLNHFREIIEHELENPSEIYVIGDLKFGMSLKQIYDTDIFKGVKYDNKEEIRLGFRGVALGHYFGLPEVDVSFHFEQNRLQMLTLTSSLYGDYLEPFINCCRKLNEIYGNPCNLFTKLCSDKMEIIPDDKAEFRVGRKCILLFIQDKYKYPKLKLQFSQSSLPNLPQSAKNLPFDENWFAHIKEYHNENTTYTPF
jgi:hypothetical protein